MMKRKFPLWLLSFTLIVLLTISCAFYLNKQKDDCNTMLVTKQGDPNILSDISLNLDTILSDEYDLLQTTTSLGSTLSTSSSFTDSYFDSDDYEAYSIHHASIWDTISEDVDTLSGKLEKGTYYYKDFYDSINFRLYCDFLTTEHDIDFSYLTCSVPDDLAFNVSGTYSNEAYISSNYNFYCTTSDIVTMHDKNYFTVENFEVSKNDTEVSSIDYTLTSGIFLLNNKKVINLYEYVLTNESTSSILGLVAIDNLNCLGLIVKEKNDTLLKLFDITAEKIVKEIPLSELMTFPEDSEYPYGDYSFYYNASSSTFTVKVEARETTLTEEQLEELDKAYETDNQHVMDKLEPFITYNTYLYVYDITSNLEVSYQLKTEIEQFFTDELRTKMQDGLGNRPWFEGTDYIYYNETLFILSYYIDNYGCPPYLYAVKDDELVYAGYISTNRDDDYTHLNYYSEDTEDIYSLNSWSSGQYSPFSRYYVNASLSLTN